MKTFRLIILLGMVVFIASGCKNTKVLKLDLAKSYNLENHLIPSIQIENEPKFYNINERMEYYNIPGFSLALIEDNRIGFEKGYGYGRKDDSILVEANSVFQVGSISKPVTALMVLKLRDAGKLQLDDNIQKYLKSWSLPESDFLNYTAITIRMLMNHTSGINNINSKGFKQSDDMPTLNDILSKSISIDTIPGTKYHYSNLGYAILQKLIEDIEEDTFSSITKKAIFEPIGMINSTFETINPYKSPVNYCYSYDSSGKVNNGYWNNIVRKSSGGLFSNPEDLAKLLIEIQKAKYGESAIFSKESIEEILKGSNYNLGFEISRQNQLLAITHTGRTPGYFTYMRLYPNLKKGIIISTNSDNGGNLFKEVLRGYSDLYDVDILKPRTIKSIETSEKQLLQFIGEYELKLDNESYIIQIQKEGKNIKYSMKSEQKEYPLRSIAKNIFIDLIDGEKLEFKTNENGQITLTTNDEHKFKKKNLD
ncbi:serine hydrolase domain-containing protein [Winogradskyella flava]|uniref:serine hydrolase domain-containing protein n=1 Tax=Winogradskyella flava TaxID=1884876 RepID=UPI002490EF7D|nr:serine hydrolase domain-containing protein [Winogradskyella flava]